MAATNAARSWQDADAPAAQARPRSWAEAVPYDIIDAGGDVADSMTPPTRARRGVPANTQRLYSVPGGRREGVTYRPPVAGHPTGASVDDPGRGYEHARPARAVSTFPAAATARMALYGLGAALAAVVLYLVVSMLVTQTQIKLDDMAYGNPRTTHLDAAVGHGDSAAQPTHFIAINLNRQVSVIELPGGDISKAVAISGPYLFGDGQDLTPVQLRTEDLNGDGKPDLIVTVKNEELVYINDKNSFRPITADEKAKLDAAGAVPAASPSK